MSKRDEIIEDLCSHIYAMKYPNYPRPQHETKDYGKAEIEAVLDYLKIDVEKNGWQPIETAPKDGRNILVYLPYSGGFIMQTFWRVERDNLQYWYCEGGELCPTYWQPPLEPPTDIVGVKGE
jgi:hypothetical protein